MWLLCSFLNRCACATGEALLSHSACAFACLVVSKVMVVVVIGAAVGDEYMRLVELAAGA